MRNVKVVKPSKGKKMGRPRKYLAAFKPAAAVDVTKAGVSRQEFAEHLEIFKELCEDVTQIKRFLKWGEK